MNNMSIRIGEGWDTHQLAVGRRLILGGVEIPYDKGLLGHSDADALTHAVIDALLGAAGMGDIGNAFPDTDAAYRDADSIALLRVVVQRLSAAGWSVGNLDCTIVAQAPKMAPHISAMRRRLAEAVETAAENVNVKAKTAEKMGPVGEGKSMEARAVALLFRQQAVADA